jgi:hypothetical protein
MPEFNQTPPEFGPSSATQISSTTPPQFSTAEYAHVPGTERCRICSTFLTGEYYRVNGQMACRNCAMQATKGQPSDSHAAFARGLLFGAGGAILGMLLYAGIVIATGWTIGYVGLAVGWIVGTAIIKGSNGLGGKRYQIAAVLLTYFAISLAYVPEYLYIVFKRGHAIANWGLFLPRLIIYGIASPFLRLARYPGSAAIGLFILFIGLRIAWQLTRPKALAVDGPYSMVTP